MRTIAGFELAVTLLTCLLATLFTALCLAQTPDANPKAPKPSVFHVKYVSKGTLYRDYSFARRYFVEGTFGWYQGNTMNYNQWSTLFGYRFGGLRK